MICSNPLKAKELESKVSETQQLAELAGLAERAEFVFVRWAAEYRCLRGPSANWQSIDSLTIIEQKK